MNPINRGGNDIIDTVKLQREFFAAGKTIDINFRKHLLINLRRMVDENESLIVEALRADLGKSPKESYLAEICMFYQEINYALKRLKIWTKPRAVPTPLYMFPSRSYRYTRPLGVALIFTPWDHPFLLAVTPLISSIAAGNCTILKLSEHSKNTTVLLMELFERYFDREYIATTTDSFAAVRAIRTERFDIVFYTGGSLVAKLVAKAAAAQLIPVVYELGGKNPCIVDKTANIKLAAKRIVSGKMLNSGQSSYAPDYLFVDSAVKDELIEHMKRYAEVFYSLNQCENSIYPKIINKMHFGRLKAYLDDGDIIFGGDADEMSNKISLTLIENLKRTSKLHFEEIFGPIMPVYEFSDIDIVINFISKRDKPLALYLFTRDKKVRGKIVKRLDFGGGCINDTVMHTANPYLPFGGVGASGYGRYRGKSGFETFSSDTSVLQSSNIDWNKLRYPPYSDSTTKAKFIFRHLT